MLFFTSQNQNSIQFDENNHLKISSQFETPEFKTAYNWLKNQYQDRKQLTIEPDSALIFGWPHFDLTFVDYPIPQQAIIVADIPESRLLASDFQAWHMVLNNWVDYDWQMIFDETKLRQNDWLSPHKKMDTQLVTNYIKKSEIIDIYR